jgi:methionyl-tRNA formyltransferase
VNVIFMGMWGVGDIALRTLLDSPDCRITGVVTRPADPDSQDPWRNRVWQSATENGLPIFTSGVNTDVGHEFLKSLQPDLILLAAFWQLIKQPILELPPLGVLNLHGSLLPKNRGVSPLNWALLRGEAQVGLTLHFVDEGMDTGDIVFQEPMAVGQDDTPGELSDRMNTLVPGLVSRALETLAQGHTLPRRSQDHTRATFAPRLRHADLQIDWGQSAVAVRNLIRAACQPNLGAWTNWQEQEIVIWGAQPSGETNAEPGTVLDVNGERLWVACGIGSLVIERRHLVSRASSECIDLRRGDQFKR